MKEAEFGGWCEVFGFARKPNDSRVTRGVVTHLDNTISEMCVCPLLPDTIMDARCVAVDPQDGTEALYGIVRDGGNAFQIECDFDERQRCVKLYLMANRSAVNEMLARGQLAAEEHVIVLARQVWREALVPHEPRQHPSPPRLDLLEGVLESWNPALPLMPHQKKTAGWMIGLEMQMPYPLAYCGNLRVTDTWFVDTESESFTTEPSMREAQLTGGICADGLGAGKTATLLHVVARTALLPKPAAPFRSNATLVIVPLNLISQWDREWKKFIRDSKMSVYFLSGKEIRTMTMSQVCQADLIVTTFHFLRSKAYSELVEGALNGRARTRPVLSSWSRDPTRVEPVLEAVRWKRVVVDELHETFENPRDLRQLKLFVWDALWGLTATPILDNEQAQHLYTLLSREKAHHPNLLARIIEQGVHCHSHTVETIPDPVKSLTLVHLSAEERFKLNLSNTMDVADIVRRCTVGAEETSSAASAATMRRETLRMKIEAHERSVRTLELTAIELDKELDALVTLCGREDCPVAMNKLECARRACEMHERDIVAARACRDTERRRLHELEAPERLLRERLSLFARATAVCGSCRVRKCDTLVRCCSRMYCRPCLAGGCPNCQTALAEGDALSVPVMTGMHTKLSEIGQLVATLDEPVILFVQWKSMVRSTRSFLSSALGIRVLLLDGNTAQRTATLSEFSSTGVLLLCLEESFAGLHLPHVRQIIFAHAIVGDRLQVERLEEQAIARCVRPGQTERVNVRSFVITETEEEQLWHRTHS